MLKYIALKSMAYDNERIIFNWLTKAGFRVPLLYFGTLAAIEMVGPVNGLQVTHS